MNSHKQKQFARTGRTLLKLHVMGAAHAVTGSLFLFEHFAQGKVIRWLLDVGLTVENQAADFQKRLPAGITAADVNFVIISHAHVDHCGYLPKLIKDGFKGQVFVTPATRDLMSIILPDSGHLQEEAAKRQNVRFERNHQKSAAQSGENHCNNSLAQARDNQHKSIAAQLENAWNDRGNRRKPRSTRRQRGTSSEQSSRSEQSNRRARKNRTNHNHVGKHSGPSEKAAFAGLQQSDSPRFKALYTQEEGQEAIKALIAVDYHVRTCITPEVAFTFSDAGHILGAAVVNLEVGRGSQKRTFCFTGNVGRRRMPLLRDLEPVATADYVMLEATYGNRLHQKRDRLAVLKRKINEAYDRAKRRDSKSGCGVILIPSFAVGRAQTVLNDLRVLMETGRVPTIPVFVDGKMMIAATEVYKHHPAIMNAETRKVLESGKDPYVTPKHTLCREWQASAALHLPHDEPIIIVSSSGMAVGGRIVNHLKHWLPGKQNTVIFVGYQGSGTLGQAIVSNSSSSIEIPDGADAVKRLPKTVSISGKPVKLGATVEFIPDYSAHADYEDQLAWLRKFKQRPKAVFIVHGNEDGLTGLKGHIEKNLDWRNIIIPKRGQVFDL